MSCLRARIADLITPRDRLIPPQLLNFVGGGDIAEFQSVGKHFLDLFIRVGELKPSHDVLDVGCGVGRMAIPLAGYLLPTARYEGFDIVPDGIFWCTRRITREYPNFRFCVADIFNASYNKSGRYRASEFPFPYDAASFDFVLLTSVFTHMKPADVSHYLDEIYRVLRPGGICFSTWFLLNEESQGMIEAGKAHRDLAFRFAADGYVAANEKVHEAAIAYTESDAMAKIAASGLSVRRPVGYGTWCGREKTVSFQDVVCATKPQQAP